MLTKMMCSFEGKNIQTQCKVLGYWIVLHFYGNKLTKKLIKMVIVIKILTLKKRQKAIKRELGCELIRIVRIDLDKKDLDTFKAIKEQFRYIKQFSNQLTK